ncbi:hypothetical protein AB0P17_24565 [Streptomyces sp. NPDC088124]|uniref:hypothetical protein n=1 Tax=Streptomyces sp. NPDC088124 TaxID=3154654 RepID=UPI00342D8620
MDSPLEELLARARLYAAPYAQGDIDAAERRLAARMSAATEDPSVLPSAWTTERGDPVRELGYAEVVAGFDVCRMREAVEAAREWHLRGKTSPTCSAARLALVLRGYAGALLQLVTWTSEAVEAGGVCWERYREGIVRAQEAVDAAGDEDTPATVRAYRLAGAVNALLDLAAGPPAAQE